MKRTFAVLVGLVLCGGCSSSGWAGEVKLDRLERFQEDNKFGFKDETGKVVIKPTYDDAGDFAFGLAPVNMGAKRDYGYHPPMRHGGRWGYINESGQYVLKPQFNETHPFRNGVARVHVGGTLREYDVHSPPIWEGGEWQLIDAKGHVLKRSKEWVEYEGSAKESLETTR